MYLYVMHGCLSVCMYACMHVYLFACKGILNMATVLYVVGKGVLMGSTGFRIRGTLLWTTRSCHSLGLGGFGVRRFRASRR